MKRRDFLAGAGLAGAGVATALSKSAIAQDKTEWKMVTSWPKGMAGLGSGAERLADRIGSLSGGRLTVKVFSAGELVPATQCLDAVSQGVADMAHDFAHYHLDKTAAAGFFCFSSPSAFAKAFSAPRKSTSGVSVLLGNCCLNSAMRTSEVFRSPARW